MTNPTFKIMDNDKIPFTEIKWYIENNKVILLARDRKDLVMHLSCIAVSVFVAHPSYMLYLWHGHVGMMLTGLC